jgi:hypothetical protein
MGLSASRGWRRVGVALPSAQGVVVVLAGPSCAYTWRGLAQRRSCVWVRFQKTPFPCRQDHPSQVARVP